MNILAVNGSPRKHGNTATLLKHALEGAGGTAAPGESADLRLVHLYDLQYTGCRSCFACKKLGGASYGRCAVRDDLGPVLAEAAHADALIFGSPVYFGDISGQMRTFLERLLFPFFVYDAAYSSIAPRRMPTAFIYTMNVTEEQMRELRYPAMMASIEDFVGRALRQPLTLRVTDTCQFDDYSKYMCECFDGEAKTRRRAEHFPKDCRAAFSLGAELVTSTKK